MNEGMNGRTDLLFMHPPAKQPQLLPPVVLAYVGDAVFELYVRQYLVSLPNLKSDHLHRSATKIVSARAQRELLEKWQPLLTEEEADIVRRGRNAKSGTPPKNADHQDYRHATALECLVGYLYYCRRLDRLQTLMDAAFGTGGQPDDGRSLSTIQGGDLG
ncbi:Mini-ribonuclease 3 [Paenibacillus tarimensis]|uniref:Mini-ribonuclease 3 n=1 Tax=Paenibacillus tarimensis TaxID=416012 RepID=UPI001F2A5124|nr:Mini-ribonuclease 3 [Paenibacillus tarimensis]MCF2946157.1 Mini-ribonuclease 3 [Paenibacillus tarimensis]